MPTCPNCQASVLQDAIYCEACGWKLDAPPPAPEEARGDRPPTHGSLRAEIPLLSGAARQIKARIEGFRERTEREMQSTRREQEIRRQEEEQTRKGKGKNFLGIVLGVALLALWIWLLVRGIRGNPPQHVLDLLTRLAKVPLDGPVVEGTVVDDFVPVPEAGLGDV